MDGYDYTLFELAEDNKLQIKEQDSQNESNTSESIGCCSRYRECSDEKTCVCPIPEIAAMCIYRRNLESGRIFYGRNAEWYDKAVDEDVHSLYAQFTQTVKGAFVSLLDAFFRQKRGCLNLVVPNTEDLLHIENSTLISVSRDYREILSCHNMNALRDSCKRRIVPPENASNSEKKQAGKMNRDLYGGPCSFAIKANVISWILKLEPEAVNNLAKPFARVKIPEKYQPYLSMLYDELLEEGINVEPVELPF